MTAKGDRHHSSSSGSASCVVELEILPEIRVSPPSKGGADTVGAVPAIGPILISGAGFLADAYDLFVIDLVLDILAHEGRGPRPQTAADKGVVASATLAGAVIGQIGFGFFADWVGRRVMFITTAILIVLGAVLSSVVQWGSIAGMGLYGQLALCRFLLGLGIGGEYPLSATVSSESAATRRRGRTVAMVFSMQGVGMLLSPVLVWIFLSANMSLERTWRTVLALGALPSALVLYFRWRMEETKLFRQAASRAAPRPHHSTISPITRQWSRLRSRGEAFAAHLRRSCRIVGTYWRPLLGTTLSWLLLDVTFYGNGSFKSSVAEAFRPGDEQTKRHAIMADASFGVLVALIAIPGYLLSVCFIDQIGRRRLQLWGFVAMGVFFALLGIEQIAGGGILSLELILFGGTFLFSNFGPNTTTFIIPAEVYPTLIRATCHGLSAASGKMGAVIGTVAFTPLQQALGLGPLLIICASVAVIGAVVTLLFTDDQEVDLTLLDRDVPINDESDKDGNGLGSPSDGRPLRAEMDLSLSDDEEDSSIQQAMGGTAMAAYEGGESPRSPQRFGRGDSSDLDSSPASGRLARDDRPFRGA